MEIDPDGWVVSDESSKHFHRKFDRIVTIVSIVKLHHFEIHIFIFNTLATGPRCGCTPTRLRPLQLRAQSFSIKIIVDYSKTYISPTCLSNQFKHTLINIKEEE